MTLYVDQREFRSKVPTYLEEMGEKYITKQLDVGDYIIGYMIESTRVIIGIERKSASDYISSLTDGTLNNQLYKCSSYFHYFLVAVEGDLFIAAENKDLHINAVFSSIAGTILRRSPDGKQGVCSFIPTMSQLGTAKLVHYINKKMASNHGLVRLPHLTSIKVNENERAVSILSCCPKVGEIRSRDILKDHKTLKNVANASLKELMNTKGVGKTIANNIYTVFNREYEVDKK